MNNKIIRISIKGGFLVMNAPSYANLFVYFCSLKNFKIHNI